LTNNGDFSNKRILLVLPEAFECAGGIQMFCRTLCLAAGRWAKRHNAQLSALALNDSTAPDTRYVNGGFASYVGAGKSKAKFIRHYLRHIATSRYDLIIFGHVSLAPLALVLSRFKSGVKTGVITYGLEVWQPLTKAQRMALEKMDFVLAISDYTKNQLSEQRVVSADKIRLFPCSLDPYWEMQTHVPATSSTPPVILSVVRMGKEDRYKGIDSVIKSLPLIVRELGPVVYRIVGRGDDVPRLKALAEQLAVSQYVSFTGGLPEEELREHYRRCSVFVMPSEKEGFGIVFLEAMAYAKPVIGGAHGGTPSVVKDGETGLLVNHQDIAGISQAIIRILSDKEMSERFGRAGRARLLNEFTFQKFESNLDEVFRSCL